MRTQPGTEIRMSNPPRPTAMKMAPRSATGRAVGQTHHTAADPGETGAHRAGVRREPAWVTRERMDTPFLRSLNPASSPLSALLLQRL